MNVAQTIFLVDDEPGMLKALARLLGAEGFTVRTFSSASEFLTGYSPDWHGCVVLDVALPDVGGLELQQQMMERGFSLPVIFLTGHGDIPMSVRAMKSGAVDFLTKPVRDEDFLAAIRSALALSDSRAASNEAATAIREKFSRLTPRELEVMSHVVAGRLNKQIAADLGTSEQTVKVHRMRVMEKMGVESVAELVRLAERAGDLSQRSLN